MDTFREWRFPEGGVGDNPFKLACSVSDGASHEEIAAAWAGRQIDPQATQLWSDCREARLFVDTEYGQWGLHILAPQESADRTAAEIVDRPSDMRSDDVVIGEFLGDQELLVLAPSEPGDRALLIALPLDHRADWDGGGNSLSAFLGRYLEAQGEKFWEASNAA
jgi:hypothetical protein